MEGDKKQTKSEFETIIEKMEKERQEMAENAFFSVTESRPFDRQDESQQFYNENEELGTRDMQLKKLGWKIVDLEREQEDLAFVCFNLLASNLLLPLNIFTNTIERKQSVRKGLWMEMAFHCTGESRSYGCSKTNKLDAKVYIFCMEKLLPMCREFINDHINWSQMIKEDFSSEKVVELFGKEVIDKANQMIKDLRR